GFGEGPRNRRRRRQGRGPAAAGPVPRRERRARQGHRLLREDLRRLREVRRIEREGLLGPRAVAGEDEARSRGSRNLRGIRRPRGVAILRRGEGGRRAGRGVAARVSRRGGCAGGRSAMRRVVVPVLFLVLAASSATAQDAIWLKTGESIACRIESLTDKIVNV